jgi:hypothetical protein
MDMRNGGVGSTVSLSYASKSCTFPDVEFYCRGNVRSVLRSLRERLASYMSTRSHDKPCVPGSFQDLLTQAKTEVFI